MKIQSALFGGQGQSTNSLRNDVSTGKSGSTEIPVMSQVSSERGIKAVEENKHSHILSIGEKELLRAIERAVKAFQGPTTSLEMSVHEDTQEVMIKVMDKETGELIREVPPEKMLDLFAKMREFAGILFDERV